MRAKDIALRLARVRQAREETEAQEPSPHTADPTRAAAAELLGVPEREISSVSAKRDGILINTCDGVTYIVVDPDTPDGDGKSGLMLKSAPTSSASVFPVFIQRRPRRPARSKLELVPSEKARPRRVDKTLQMFEAELERVTEAGGAEPSNRTMRTEQQEALKLLIREREGQLREEELRRRPPAPDEVSYWESVLAWADAVLSATTDREARERDLEHKARAARLATFRPAFADRDQMAARQWLAHHCRQQDDD